MVHTSGRYLWKPKPSEEAEEELYTDQRVQEVNPKS